MIFAEQVPVALLIFSISITVCLAQDGSSVEAKAYELKCESFKESVAFLLSTVKPIESDFEKRFASLKAPFIEMLFGKKGKKATTEEQLAFIEFDDELNLGLQAAYARSRAYGKTKDEIALTLDHLEEHMPEVIDKIFDTVEKSGRALASGHSRLNTKRDALRLIKDLRAKLPDDVLFAQVSAERFRDGAYLAGKTAKVAEISEDWPCKNDVTLTKKVVAPPPNRWVPYPKKGQDPAGVSAGSVDPQPQTKPKKK